jgi:branched-chain amino acid aminotransferase
MPNRIILTEKYLVFNSSIQLVAELYYDYSNNAKVLYEVVRVKNSTPIFLEHHLNRLYNSVKLLRLMAPESSFVTSKIKELLQKNPVVENNIRISLVYDMSTLPNLLVYFIPSSYPTVQQRIDGVTIKSLNSHRDNPNIKIENSELREIADKLIKTSGCYEVLMINDNGFITEGSRSNIFFVKGDSLYTPPLEIVLGGITRSVLIEKSKEQGIPLKEELIPFDALSTFDGAILTGTSPGILPITSIDNQKFSVNLPLIISLIDQYSTTVENDILTFKA